MGSGGDAFAFALVSGGGPLKKLTTHLCEREVGCGITSDSRLRAKKVVGSGRVNSDSHLRVSEGGGVPRHLRLAFASEGGCSRLVFVCETAGGW